MVDQAGVRELVKHAGEVDKPYEMLRQGHVFLLTSRIEGCPNALIEAMNIGLPCIATKVGDLPALANGEADLPLVDHGDVEGMVNVLEKVFTHWSDARVMGGNLRKLCRKRFSSEHLGSKLVSLLAKRAH